MPLREDILVTLQTEGVPDLIQVSKAMKKLGFNLRLAGRDLMRMAGGLQRLSGFLMGFTSNVFKSSDIVSDAFGDIGMALEDIFEDTGILESFVEILEWVAEILEANPWIAYVLAALAIVGVFVLIMSKIMMLGGFIKLLIGSVFSAETAHMSWTEKIGFTAKALLGLNEQLRRNLSLQVQVLAYAKQQGITYAEAWKQVDKLAKGQGVARKEASKWKEGMKKIGKVAIAGTAIFGGLLGLFMMAEPIMEIMGAVFDVVGQAIEVIITPFEDLIWQVIEFFEARPELLAALLLAVVGAILAMKASGFVQWLKDTVGGAGSLIDKVGPAKDKVAGLGTEIIKLAAAIGILLVAMAGAIWILSQTGYTIPEIVSLMGALTVSVITLGGTFIAFAIILGAVGMAGVTLVPILLPLAAVLLAIGTAGFLIGAGFLAAGVGIKLATQGIASLVGNVSGVIALVGALFALGLAMFMVGAAAFPAMAGIFGLALAVGALAASLVFLAVPLGMIKSLGGTPAVLAAINKLPSFQEGGFIQEGGLAVVHPKETIVPAKGKPLGGGYQPKEPPMTVTVDVTGVSSVEEIIQRAVEASVDQLSVKFEKRFRRSEY